VGAVNVLNKKCEDCGLIVAGFGLPSDGKKRWCSGCANGHGGAVDFANKKCEGCQLKRSSFGLPSDGKVRWCFGCAKAHAGVVDLANKSKMCEGCQLKRSSFGLPAEGKVRWCSDCAPKEAQTDGGGRTKVGGSLQKKPKATGQPLTISDLRASVRGPYIRRWEIPMTLAPELGSVCGRRAQTAKKATAKKQKATAKKPSKLGRIAKKK
jgi:hypothetical protein